MRTWQRFPWLTVTWLMGACASTAGSEQSGDGVAAVSDAPGCPATCQACDPGYTLVDCTDLCVCGLIDDPNAADHQTLAACEATEPCPQSSVSGTIGGYTWTGGECFLSHLRDRTPGRYLASWGFSEGGGGRLDYVLLLDGSETATVLEADWGFTPGRFDSPTLSYRPPQRCSLKSATDFDACLLAGTELTGSEFPSEDMCEELLDWVDDCTPVLDTTCPVAR